jgi:hypothetical protein
VGAALKYSFGSELWFAETIGGTPLADWWTDPSDSYERLFGHGTRAKALISGILGRFTPEDWSRVVELKSPQLTLKVTARKARQHGIAPPGSADLILSRVLEQQRPRAAAAVLADYPPALRSSHVDAIVALPYE